MANGLLYSMVMKALIVDGYNAIHKIPHVRRAADRSLQIARQTITELTREYQRRYGGIDRVCVVFDGKNEYRDQPHRALPDQVFSRTGEGDSEVIRIVRRFSRRYHVLVVSDDNFVRNNARAHSATVISVAAFLTSLRKKNLQWKRREPSKEVHPNDMAQINEELRKFWDLH